MCESFGDARRVVSAALILIVVIFANARATAEIFKCAQPNGLDRYQNFPCSVDSIGSLPSMPASTTPLAVGARDAAPALATRPRGSSSKAGEPRVGMTANEVIAIWGTPLEAEQEERWKGRVDVWHYGDGRSVEFSKKQRVLEVRR